MVERLLRAQPVSVASHVKARQSMIEWSKLAKILLIYIYVFLCVICTYNVNVLCIKFSDILAYFMH